MIDLYVRFETVAFYQWCGTENQLRRAAFLQQLHVLSKNHHGIHNSLSFGQQHQSRLRWPLERRQVWPCWSPYRAKAIQRSRLLWKNKARWNDWQLWLELKVPGQFRLHRGMGDTCSKHEVGKIFACSSTQQWVENNICWRMTGSESSCDS